MNVRLGRTPRLSLSKHNTTPGKGKEVGSLVQAALAQNRIARWLAVAPWAINYAARLFQPEQPCAHLCTHRPKMHHHCTIMQHFAMLSVVVLSSVPCGLCAPGGERQLSATRSDMSASYHDERMYANVHTAALSFKQLAISIQDNSTGIAAAAAAAPVFSTVFDNTTGTGPRERVWLGGPCVAERRHNSVCAPC